MTGSANRPTGAADDRPLVSIITAVRNGAGTIERALASVRAQRYGPIEHIVIDGASSDGTPAILARHAGQLAYWSSEPDQGISDGFNRGLAQAKGALIGLLNADDWLEPDQIQAAVTALAESGADFVFGDLTYHDAAGRPLHVIKGDPGYASTIDALMPALNHPTMLVRKTAYARVGGFDLRYRVAMDYDWVLRAHRAGLKGAYAPGIHGHMTLAGTSDRAFVAGLAEVRAIALAHGAAWPLAHARFGYRVAKGLGQRLLFRLAPAGCYHALRGRFNRAYRRLPEDLAR